MTGARELALRRLASASSRADQARARAVAAAHEARRCGASLEDVATALGMSKEGARRLLAREGATS